MLDARNVNLERAIVASPNDVDSYLVYADWLIEQGDPRGDLVTAQIAAESGDAAARRSAIAVFAKHRDYLFGGLADKLRADALDWKRGYIHHAQLANSFLVVEEGRLAETPLGDVARELFAHPSARFLAKLTIGDVDPPPPPVRWPRRELQPTAAAQTVFDALIAARPLALRELVLLDPSAGCRLEWCNSLASVTDLDVTGRFTAEGLAMPNLTSATFRGPTFTSTQLRELVRARLPSLRSLSIDLGSGTQSSQPPELEDFMALFARVDLPLDHLAIANCRFGNKLIGQLATSPMLRTLGELQLTDGSLDDRGIRAIAKDARAFAHLELFDLTGNKLTEAGKRTLAQLAPHAIA